MCDALDSGVIACVTHKHTQNILWAKPFIVRARALDHSKSL